MKFHNSRATSNAAYRRLNVYVLLSQFYIPKILFQPLISLLIPSKILKFQIIGGCNGHNASYNARIESWKCCWSETWKSNKGHILKSYYYACKYSLTMKTLPSNEPWLFV